MTEKTVNYTNEMTDEIVASYKVADTEDARASVVEAMANKFGKTTRSIVAKLSREGVYVAKTAKTKTGAKVQTKAAMVDEIAVALGAGRDDLASLENASKDALAKVLLAVGEIREIAEDFSQGEKAAY